MTDVRLAAARQDDMPEATRLIEVSAVTKRFSASDRPAIDQVSLHVDRGELLAITGKSGSGKSTLLNLMAGLLTPDEGSVSFAGTNLRSMGDDEAARFRAQHIGFVFQSFDLIDELRVADNVVMPAVLAGRGARETRELAEEVLDQLAIRDLADRMPGQLSGGEQQRVAIARVLVQEPSVILADEPTGDLDTQSGEDVVALLVAANRRGLTVVVVTHDADVAGACPRQVVLSDGRVVADGAR